MDPVVAPTTPGLPASSTGHAPRADRRGPFGFGSTLPISKRLDKGMSNHKGTSEAGPTTKGWQRRLWEWHCTKAAALWGVPQGFVAALILLLIGFFLNHYFGNVPPHYRLQTSRDKIAFGQTATVSVVAFHENGEPASTAALRCLWQVQPYLAFPPQPQGCALTITAAPADFPTHSSVPRTLQITATQEDSGNPIGTTAVTLYPLNPPTVTADPRLPYGGQMRIGYRFTEPIGNLSFFCFWKPITVFGNPNDCNPTMIAPPNVGAYPSGAIPISVTLTAAVANPGNGTLQSYVTITSPKFIVQLYEPSAPPPPATSPSTAAPTLSSPTATRAATSSASSALPPPASAPARPASPVKVALLGKTVSGTSGANRLAALRVAIARFPPSQQVSVTDALHLLGDLPPPDLRRSGLEALLPRLALPIAPADAVRLVEGFTDTARAQLLLDFEACILRPVTASDQAKLLEGVGSYYQQVLTTDLSAWSTCPWSGGQGPTTYGFSEDTVLRETPEQFGVAVASLLAGDSTVRAVPGPQTDPEWLHVETPQGQIGYVVRDALVPQNQR
jgi:hypothetical protein